MATNGERIKALEIKVAALEQEVQALKAADVAFAAVDVETDQRLDVLEQEPAPEPPEPQPPEPTPTVVKRIGAGWSMDTLHETTTGSGHRAIADRFKADRNGSIVAVRWWMLGVAAGSGYAGGNGGAGRGSMRGANPNGSNLAEYSWSDMALNQPGRRFVFDRPVPVTKGEVMHHVMENTTASPDTNFFGQDNFWLSNVDTRRFEGRCHPMLPDDEWAVLYRQNSNGQWVTRPGHAPILDIEYADGTHQGCGYMEVGYTNAMPRSVAGSNKIRQLLGSSMRIKRVGVFLSKQAGTTAPLRVTVGGVTKEIPASAFGDGPASGAWQQGDRPSWGAVDIDATGDRITFESSGTFYCRAIRKGTDPNGYGYHASTVGPGWGEYTSDGQTWTPMYHWGQTSLQRKDDIKYFVDVAI